MRLHQVNLFAGRKTSGTVQHGSESVSERLDALTAVEQTMFLARVERVRNDALAALHRLYGSAAPAVLDRLLAVAVAIANDRPEELRHLDAVRSADPSWFQAPEMVGYVAYADQFGGTVEGVRSHVSYLEELGVRYFHLMNVLQARPEPNDGGFAVLDYRAIEPALGTMQELRLLADDLRRRGISLCIDLVMNHTAAEHEWAAKARGGDPHYREYFHLFADRTLPDQYERTLPEVFPEMAPGNFTWCPELEAWVWTTFNTYQWDLNYTNPDVLIEMFEIMGALVNNGVDVLRLDAVAFTWKRLGTDCQNQPEAHLIVQVLRALMDVAAPGVILKAEAIVGPRELTTYLGAHHRERPECQIAYHNQLMVNIWSSLASRDAVLMAQAMGNLPATPTGAGWVTYVRCHDDIGWAIDDADASAVGISGARHRAFLARFFRGDFPGTFAHGASFSVNEETGDERTCGMAASLCGIRHAVDHADELALELGIQRMLLAYGVAASFGMPLVYMGDELALGDDASYSADPSRADDSRWMHRPPMDWSIAARRHDPSTLEGRVFGAFQTMLATRSRIRALSQGGTTEILRPDDHRVFAFARRHPRHGNLLGIANFAEHPVGVGDWLLAAAGVSQSATEWRNDRTQREGDRIVMAPLGLAWFAEDESSLVLPR